MDAGGQTGPRILGSSTSQKNRRKQKGQGQSFTAQESHTWFGEDMFDRRKQNLNKASPRIERNNKSGLTKRYPLIS